jgi:hypothetical protein
MCTYRYVDEGVGVGLLVRGRDARANRFFSSFGCRVGGGRKQTMAKQVAIFVAQGNSSGLHKKIVGLVVSRVPHAWGCFAGGVHALRERTGSVVVCPLYGVDVLQRVVVTVSRLGVVPVSFTRSSVEVGRGVGSSIWFCWRDCVGKRFD